MYPSILWKLIANPLRSTEYTSGTTALKDSFENYFWIQNFKDQDIQNYNFARGPVWVWNLVADIEGGM